MLKGLQAFGAGVGPGVAGLVAERILGLPHFEMRVGVDHDAEGHHPVFTAPPAGFIDPGFEQGVRLVPGLRAAL